jgi:hypothetical protein
MKSFSSFGEALRATRPGRVIEYRVYHLVVKDDQGRKWATDTEYEYLVYEDDVENTP